MHLIYYSYKSFAQQMLAHHYYIIIENYSSQRCSRFCFQVLCQVKLLAKSKSQSTALAGREQLCFSEDYCTQGNDSHLVAEDRTTHSKIHQFVDS